MKNYYDYNQIFSQILTFDLTEIIGKDTKLKKLNNGTWHGQSPFRDDKKPSFSVGMRDGQWYYYDHATNEGGNIFTYLKLKHNISGLINVANYLGITFISTDKITPITTDNKNIDYSFIEKREKLEIINHSKKALSKRLLNLTLFGENEPLTDNWSYPEYTFEFIDKTQGTLGRLEIINLTAQKYRGEDGAKRWRYLANDKIFHSKQSVLDHFRLADFPIDLYRFNEFKYDADYLLITEGESDCEAALSLGFNASCFPSPNLENQIELLKKLRENYPNISTIIYLADNDFAGIKKAYTTAKASFTVGLPCLPINLATGKRIKRFDTSDLPNYQLIEKKHTNDNQGYDLRDYLRENTTTDLIKLIERANKAFSNDDSVKNTIVITDKKEIKERLNDEYCIYYLKDLCGYKNQNNPEKTLALAILDKDFTENLRRSIPITFYIESDKNIRNFEITARQLSKKYEINITFDLKRKITLNQWDSHNLIDMKSLINLSVNERYLGNHTPDPEADIIGLKAAKGTGKTEWLKKIISNNISTGKQTLLISHRIQLGAALCSRFGLNYIDNIDDAQRFFGVGLCVDSLHPYGKARINPENWYGADIVLDEVEQIFWHLLSSSTEVRKRRSLIINTLREILKQAVAGGGKIYCSDADLSPISIAFIKSLLGYNAQTWVLNNEFKPYTNRKAIIFGEANPSNLINQIYHSLDKKEKIFISTSAQKSKSSWGTTNLESHLSRKYPDRKILRIDAITIADPEHEAFGIINFLNENLTKYDIVIASPAIETGVSIDIKGHFAKFFGIYQGHQTVNSVAQSIERIREDIPRYIWCNEHGHTSRVAGGEQSVRELLKSQHKNAKATIKNLSDTFLGNLDIDLNQNGEALLAWAKYASLINQDVPCYKDALIKKLHHDGYKIQIDQSLGINFDISQKIKEEKVENYLTEVEKILNSPDLTDEQLKILQAQKAKTYQEILTQKKAELSRRYLVDLSSLIVQFDDANMYKYLLFYYYLYLDQQGYFGEEILKLKEFNKVGFMAKNNDNQGFLPDINQSTMILKFKYFKHLRLDTFLGEGVWTSENLADYREFLISQKDDIKRIFKITISEGMSGIQIVQELLKGIVGVSLTGKQVVTESGKIRVYSWQGKGIEVFYEPVMLNWFNRDMELWNQSQADLAI